MHALVGAIYCLGVIYACSVELNYCTLVYALTRDINLIMLITIQLYRYINVCYVCFVYYATVKRSFLGYVYITMIIP